MDISIRLTEDVLRELRGLDDADFEQALLELKADPIQKAVRVSDAYPNLFEHSQCVSG